ncbi:MAG: hypothetical protein IKN27_10155 [Selenomonadaceae bacterium]|nr:hypothetical protein [Selenomonadaceae bacterium]
MANREDNIKKINAELEAMSDDELDQVAGGTYNNTAADSRILNQLGFGISGRSALECFWIPTFQKTAKDVANVFDKFGIRVEQSWGAVQNRYYIAGTGGQEISREKAFQIVADAVGKPLPKLDY